MAAPYINGGEIVITQHVGSTSNGTRWMTWVFSGHARVFSWWVGTPTVFPGNQRNARGRPTPVWLQVRLQRLGWLPVLPLIVHVDFSCCRCPVAWPAWGNGKSRLANVTYSNLVPGGLHRRGGALFPLHLMPGNVLALSLSGFLSLAAVIDDLLFFAADLRALGWLNYGFVWLAVHQLGLMPGGMVIWLEHARG